MRRVGIVYATREGQSRLIARHIGNYFHEKGMDVEIMNAKTFAPDLDSHPYDGLILVASVHAGRHEREMVGFVKDNLDGLAACPTAFISVSMSEAGVELPGLTPEQRGVHLANVQQVLERFYDETGWHPFYVKPVAGAVLYTHYNFLLRFIMKGISKKAGGSTDTSRDHEYTDWAALDRFIAQFEAALPSAEAPLRREVALWNR